MANLARTSANPPSKAPNEPTKADRPKPTGCSCASIALSGFDQMGSVAISAQSQLHLARLFGVAAAARSSEMQDPPISFGDGALILARSCVDLQYVRMETPGARTAAVMLMGLKSGSCVGNNSPTA